MKESNSWKGHGRTPYGYEYDSHNNLVIHPQQAKILKDVFTKAQQTKTPKGVPFSELAIYLNSKGVKSSRGKLWSYKTVGYLFAHGRLFFYAGYKDENLLGNWDAIIDLKTAKKLISLYPKESPKEIKPKSIKVFTGLGILRCGECDSPVKSVGFPYKEKSYNYYSCSGKAYRGKNACPNTGVWDYNKINELILTDLTVHLAKDSKIIMSLSASLEKKRLNNINDQVKNLDAKIGKLFEMQTTGEIKNEKELNSKLRPLSREKTKLLQSKNDVLDENNLKQAVKIKSLPVGSQNKLIPKLIEKIALHKEYVTITYRFCYASNKNIVKLTLEN